MKRLLFVHGGKGIGGAPLTLLAIIKSLDRSRYTPHVLCLYESEAADLFRSEGIETEIGKGIYHLAHTTGVWYPVHYMPMLFYRLFLFPVSLINAYRYLSRHHFDIVHLNGSGLLSFAIAARLRHIPVLLHVLEHLHHGYFGFRRFVLSRLLTGFSNAAVFICKSDASMFPRSLKIHIIYDSIDPDRFDPDRPATVSKSAVGIPEDAMVVGMLGGISHIKGTLEFVKAAAGVVRSVTDVHFLILGYSQEGNEQPRKANFITAFKQKLSGEEKYRSKVLSEADVEPLKGKIHFLPSTLDVASIIKMLDVLVFPSTTPHYARPLIEAGMMKKAVVASRLGGPDEIVIDGLNGYLVTACDPGELSNKIVTLLKDAALREHMGIAGRTRAMEMFNSRKNIPEILKLYDVIEAK